MNHKVYSLKDKYLFFVNKSIKNVFLERSVRCICSLFIILQVWIMNVSDQI